MIDPYYRGDVMQSFFRFMLVICLLIVAFVGGWFSSDLVKQDPFLSNIFNVQSDQYDRFVRDISSTLQEMRVIDQNQLIEALMNQIEVPSFANIRELDHRLDSSLHEAESGGEHDEDPTDEPPIANELGVDSVAVVDPNDMLGTIVQQMSTKEKFSFVYWARTRFTDEQLRQIEILMQDGITPDNFLTLYQFTRKSLNGNDYEYLLSFVDRYLNSMEQYQDREDAIPVFQANEGPR